MTRVYLDSSAFLKKFSIEKNSDIVEDIFERCEKGNLIVVVSQWTINECIKAFDKKMMKGEMGPNEINSKIIDAISWVENRKREGRVELVEVNDELMGKSIGFIRFNHLSADDALHAYCAIMGSSNMIVMDDERFSYWLKNPDVKSSEEDSIRPKYSYHVINLSEPEDVKKFWIELK